MSIQPTTSTGCGVCAAPTGDGARLCRTHTDDLRDQLVGVPERVIGAVELAAELDVTVTRQSRTTTRTEGRRTPERPLPWNENASAAAHILNTTLNAWALDVSRLGEDERDRLADIPAADTAAVAEWLARNLSTLRHHPEAGQAHDEILSAIREARRAIDRPADPVPFGPCGRSFEDGTVCQAVLYGQLDRPQVRCRDCGALHPIRDRLEWMLEHLRGLIATLPELVAIAKLAGKRTTEDSLRLMADRGRFEQAGVDVRGRPTYRVADVMRALDERHKRRPKVA